MDLNCSCGHALRRGGGEGWNEEQKRRRERKEGMQGERRRGRRLEGKESTRVYGKKGEEKERKELHLCMGKTCICKYVAHILQTLTVPY